MAKNARFPPLAEMLTVPHCDPLSEKGRMGICPPTATSAPAGTSLEVAVETVGNPKKWLSDQMPHGSIYKETTHQVSLSKEIDLDIAREKSRSFRRPCQALEQLVAGIDQAFT